MKLVPWLKFDKQNKSTAKSLYDDVISANYDMISADYDVIIHRLEHWFIISWNLLFKHLLMFL